ncbi:hypothetical protein [Nitrosomonas sp.]|uniref:hypothetical protein n=1 Tax=Nitrosomonas sp. TaxID=42353 RepID=UPI0025F919DC|nr:hypothetical protein [Nitrosomonas sp.]
MFGIVCHSQGVMHEIQCPAASARWLAPAVAGVDLVLLQHRRGMFKHPQRSCRVTMALSASITSASRSDASAGLL